MPRPNEPTIEQIGRIGYVLDKYGAPSQTFITNEVEELRRQGVTVEIVAVAGDPAPGALVLQPSGPSRSKVLASHTRWFLRSPLRYRRFLKAVGSVGTETHSGEAPHAQSVPWKHLPYVASWLSARGINQLHAHFAWSGAAAAHCLAALTGWRWSMTVHANDIFSRTRNLKAKLDSADMVITVCDYNALFLRKQLGFTGWLEKVVCGVEDPGPLEASEPRYDIVAVGRLVEKKGFDLLIAATAALVESYPAVRVQIVGDGKLGEQLREQTRALGLESNVTFAGALDHDATLAAISAAQVFCLPARIAADGDRDSMPVVIKEAMVRGVPVVASGAVGIPEMLDPSYSRIVPVDDAPALASALADELALSSAERATRGELARSAALARFSLADWVATLRGHLSALSR